MRDDMLIQPSPRAAFRAIAGGESGVVLHMDSGAYYELNEVGTLIWEVVEGGSTLGRVIERLLSELVDATPNLRDDVEQYLRELANLDLVHFGTENGEHSE